MSAAIEKQKRKKKTQIRNFHLTQPFLRYLVDLSAVILVSRTLVAILLIQTVRRTLRAVATRATAATATGCCNFISSSSGSSSMVAKVIGRLGKRAYPTIVVLIV